MKPLYLFFDFETTGLDPVNNDVLEIAAAVVDKDLNIISQFEIVVNQEEDALAQMDDWCRGTHTKSGLLERVQNSSVGIMYAESLFLAWMDKYFPGNRILLAGNSIHFDRSFIRVHMPRLDKRLHYRMVDVSSFAIVIENTFGSRMKKVNAHRAMPDVLESIQELKEYLDFLSGKK